ncbi:hypothetical protein AACH06_13535 [Ideonella sp. DXS29W]|uniref:Right-handed parallel beta-helix repeat-containing protein n=1 Tax=Ideonella lacteola TaxID=2984193 RepID=A0ABU9BRU2_9BURK
MQRRRFVQTLSAGTLLGPMMPLRLLAQSGSTIDAGEFLKLDGKPEDQAFEALIAKLRTTSGPKVVRFPTGQRTLALAGGHMFDLPSDTRWDFGRTTVRYDGTIEGNSVLIRFGAKSEVLGMNLMLASSAHCDRLVTFVEDTLVDRLQVSAERQFANGGNDNSDGLIQVRGSRVRMTACSIAGVDRPVAIIGSGAKPGEMAALVDVRVSDMRLRQFVCGMLVHNTQDCLIDGLVAETKSSNARTDPGHNAVLAARVQNFVLQKFRIEDSGEHAIRIGGSTNPNEAPNKNIRISDGTIRRPGKCGVKFWSAGKAEDVADAAVVGATVRGLSIFDCGFGGKISVNEDAVRLEVVNDFTVEDIKAAADKSAASCHDVVYLAGCGNGQVRNVTADRAVRSAVYITETLGAGRSAPVGSIRGSDIRSTNHRGDLVHLELPTQAAGPFDFSKLSAQGGVSFVGGNAPNAVGESRFDGKADRLSGPMNALNGDKRKLRVTGGR